MFERIVVGTDGSETASEAVRRAIELARLSGASSPSSRPSSRCPQTRVREEKGERAGRRVLRGRAARGRERHPRRRRGAWPSRKASRPSRIPRQGDPADAILDVAEQTNADLIVVGNKGMTGAKRFLLGSVPNKVSHHAPCGVYIVRTT